MKVVCLDEGGQAFTKEANRLNQFVRSTPLRELKGLLQPVEPGVLNPIVSLPTLRANLSNWPNRRGAPANENLVTRLRQNLEKMAGDETFLSRSQLAASLVDPSQIVRSDYAVSTREELLDSIVENGNSAIHRLVAQGVLRDTIIDSSKYFERLYANALKLLESLLPQSDEIEKVRTKVDTRLKLWSDLEATKRGVYGRSAIAQLISGFDETHIAPLAEELAIGQLSRLPINANPGVISQVFKQLQDKLTLAMAIEKGGVPTIVSRVQEKARSALERTFGARLTRYERIRALDPNGWLDPITSIVITHLDSAVISSSSNSPRIPFLPPIGPRIRPILEHQGETIARKMVSRLREKLLSPSSSDRSITTGQFLHNQAVATALSKINPQDGTNTAEAIVDRYLEDLAKILQVATAHLTVTDVELQKLNRLLKD